MPRFFVPPEDLRGNRFTIKGSEAHHAHSVLRKKVGDEIDLFDGRDAAYTGRIEAISADAVQGVLLERVTAVKTSFHLILYQAMLKGPKWDWLLEKASEVGVSEIVPLFTERTLIQPKESAQENKLERWNRIAVAAAKQCGRADVLRVRAPIRYDRAMAELPLSAVNLIPWEKEDTTSVAQACRKGLGERAGIFIGPEGGWSAEEIAVARSKNVLPVRLGPTVLRSETAGLIASTLMLREKGIY